MDFDIEIDPTFAAFMVVCGHQLDGYEEFLLKQVDNWFDIMELLGIVYP